MPFPGFVGTLGADVSVPAQKLGHLGWLLSFSVSFIVYYLICLVWPTKNQKLIREMGLKWEEMGAKDIVALDGTLITTSLEGYPDPELDHKDKKWGESSVGESESPTRDANSL